MINIIRQIGKITSTKGPSAIVEGLSIPIGSFVRISHPNGKLAQCISFDDKSVTIMPVDENIIWQPGLNIYTEPVRKVALASQALGRVIDALGNPLDEGPPLLTTYPTAKKTMLNPMHRTRLSEQLDVGVRAINALIPVASGQRLGIFAGSGVGKSTLISMMAKYTNADRVVIALIGERSREVREFVEDNLGPEGLHKSIVVAVTAGQPALMKMLAADYACDLADQFKSQGHSCLLIMDSLTRYAMACREVGLACGEPPSTKGYPPSAFAKVNALVERAGAGSESNNEGNITAFYTVLSEGDDMQDPVADNSRAILDGHIVLSRQIAERGIYPPIDLSASISRATSAICTPEHKNLMQVFRSLLGAYTQNEDLIKAGAYQIGQDQTIDLAIKKINQMWGLVKQDQDQPSSITESIDYLSKIITAQ